MLSSKKPQKSTEKRKLDALCRMHLRHPTGRFMFEPKKNKITKMLTFYQQKNSENNNNFFTCLYVHG